MTRTHRAVRIFMLLMILVLLASACGGGTRTAPNRSTIGVRGGTFKIAASDDVDYIDPGQIYYTFSYMLFRVMIRNLVSYPALPGDRGNTLIADIAKNKGDVSADNLTYTFEIKDRIKFQPDTAGGRQVESRDFRYAIERGFYPSVANGYANLYFKDLFDGDEAFLKAPSPATHITGINVSDPKKVVFKLKRATGDFLYRLALPLASPVPEEHAKPFDAKTQSEYGPNFAATGPYKLERAAPGGKVTGYVAKKKISMVRNENWVEATDPIRKAFPDRFEVTEGFEDTAIATDKILNGDFDYNGDFNIPPEKQQSILSKPDQKSRIFFNASNCFRYVSLNTRIKPFNNPKVRQAVAYVMDKQAMRLTRGGKNVGEIATHMLIPGINGFEQSGGRQYDPYPSKDFKGDVDKAKAKMVEAGYPGGMYTGPPVLMVGASSGTAPKTAAVVAASLAKIGIKVNRQQYAGNIMYTRYYSVPKANVVVGPNPGWCWDYPDSFTVIGPLFDGRQITATGNNNYAELKDNTLNGIIDRAKSATGTRRAALWAEANKRAMELAPVIPWLWDAQPNLISTRVVGYQFTLSSSSIDLAVVSLRQGT